MKAIETVKSYYDNFNERNWNGMLSLVADDIRHEPNQGEPRIGKELFTAFLKQMDDAYEETLADIVI